MNNEYITLSDDQKIHLFELVVKSKDVCLEYFNIQTEMVVDLPPHISLVFWGSGAPEKFMVGGYVNSDFNDGSQISYEHAVNLLKEAAK